MEDLDLTCPVELIEPGARGDLRVRRTPMTLQHALDLFLGWPEDRQNRSGISLQQPIPIDLGGRAALAGYLNGWAVRAILQADWYAGHR
jgi:hypothetical protein